MKFKCKRCNYISEDKDTPQGYALAWRNHIRGKKHQLAKMEYGL